MDAHADPFYLVKDEVARAVDEIGCIYKKWQELLDNTNTAENDEFEFTTRELNDNLGSIEEDLKALQETVSIVEQHQKKFGLAEDDLQQRRAFINNVKKRIQEIRSKIDSPAAVAKIDRDRRAALFLNDKNINEASTLRGDLAISAEREDQALLFKQQDEVLDDIHDGASQLHDVAIEMGRELKDQTKMLEDVNQSTSDLQVRLAAANNKVADLIETTLSTKQKLMTIVCLSLLLIILTFLVFN